MKKKFNEPSLFRKLITIHYEKAQMKKALRILEKQDWSFDFLVDVVRKAAKLSKQDVTVTIVSKGGNELHITGKVIDDLVVAPDDDIFNHLDDTAVVNNFIREHSRR